MRATRIRICSEDEHESYSGVAQMKDCHNCQYKRRIGSRLKGVRIPDGEGKCIRPEGHCDPDIVPGKIGEGPRIRKLK